MKTDSSRIEVAGIAVQVIRKSIKNLHLTVRPPDASVRISAPRRMTDAQIARVITAKLDWIRRKRAAIVKRELPPRLEYVTGETHLLRGDPYLLEVVERGGPPSVEILDGSRLMLSVPPGSDRSKREAVMMLFYRQCLLNEVPDLIGKWEPVLGVSVAEWRVRRMKTRWGSCNIRDRRIWLNLELARTPPRCLEYVLVHEMAHLLERGHNARFRSLMERFLPGWRLIKDELNDFPLARE